MLQYYHSTGKDRRILNAVSAVDRDFVAKPPKIAVEMAVVRKENVVEVFAVVM